MKSSTPQSIPLVPEVLLPGEDVAPSRRAFLQCAGYGVAASLVGGCSPGPARGIIPYLTAPTELIPGRGYQIATTCGGCSAACGVLARCRDGRPIKLEGNPMHRLSRGGLCAMGQAEVLSLYDSKRITAPTREGGTIPWESADEQLRGRLQSAAGGGRKIRLLTGTEHGPSTRAAIELFQDKYATAGHITYNGLSVSALLDAHARTHGQRVLPSMHFDRSRVTVSFDADFLGTWISPVSFAADYSRGRKPDKPEGWMSRHIQLEARLSLTGSAADERHRLTPGQLVPALAALVQELEKRAATQSLVKGWLEDNPHALTAASIAAELWEARGESLVICGQNSAEAQELTAYANHLLGNYGKTLSLVTPSHQRSDDDGALQTLRSELEAGEVDILIVSGVNPAYDLPGDFAGALAKASTLVVHTAERNETALLAKLVLPQSHFLEAWGDGEPQAGRFSLAQPSVPPLRDSRTLRELLSRLCGDESSDLELVKRAWKTRVHGQVAPDVPFETFFDGALHDGYVESQRSSGKEPAFLVDSIKNPASPQQQAGLSLVLYPKLGLLDGRGAHNPWLQELPDPVSKVTWDNYACLSPGRAESLGLKDGDVVRIRCGDSEAPLELPVLVQRGQHDDVVAVALGYGRRGTDRFAKVGPEWFEGKATVEKGQVIGVNMAPHIQLRDGELRYDGAPVTLEPTDKHIDLAATQDHHTLEIPAHLAPKHGEVRDAVRVASFASYSKDPAHAFDNGHHPAPAEMWQLDHEPQGHHWGMSIDLASCIGCSACSVSCQAENNVPVVGKDEVLRHREMHWMRIDRYLAGEGDDVTAHYQPMFCQQCDNAPCEGVCPVLATVHSTEGLNQQVYNRCVGTRYCANTCPYKVRRFNWFNYPHEDHLANQSLNPDVTIRTRGVMEKCSFCAQRIQQAKSESKRTGVPLADGDIQVACQQSCPTQAIVFGDMADPESRVSKMAEQQRSYRVLEELNVKPSVHYLGRVRNNDDKTSEGEHHG